MGSQTRSIRIRDATLDDSLEAIARVFFEGMNTTVLYQRLFPDGGSPSAREKYMSRLRNAISPNPSSTSSMRVYVKVAELMPSNGEEPKIIAIAKWEYLREPLPVEVEGEGKQAEMTQEELGEGADLEFFRAFMGEMEQFKKEAMGGGRHLHLGTLVCHPDYRGLGAASALMQWGVELADEEQVSAFLEGSPQAYPLYRRFGFEDIQAHDFVLENSELIAEKDLGAEMGLGWGEKPKGSLRTAIMRRFPIPR